jgi:hypothetical protein
MPREYKDGEKLVDDEFVGFMLCYGSYERGYNAYMYVFPSRKAYLALLHSHCKGRCGLCMSLDMSAEMQQGCVRRAYIKKFVGSAHSHTADDCVMCASMSFYHYNESVKEGTLLNRYDIIDPLPECVTSKRLLKMSDFKMHEKAQFKKVDEFIIQQNK